MMYLIAELCGQHSGSLRRLEQMALQAKAAGADAVKVQLYDTHRMPGDYREKWAYLDISFDELKRFKVYCDMLRIDLFASFFDEERLGWCLELNFPILKIASYVLQQWPNLAEKSVATGRRTLVSLGMYNWQKKGAPFTAPNVEYLYTVPKYPGTIEGLAMPDFSTHPFFCGYSDHTPGTTAVSYALLRVARVIEKHFTVSKALRRETEKGHFCAMTWNELAQIRNFADELALLKKGETVP